MRRSDGDVCQILGTWVRDHSAVGEGEDFRHIDPTAWNHVEGARSNTNAGCKTNVSKCAAQHIRGGIDGARDAGVSLSGANEPVSELEWRRSTGVDRPKANATDRFG